jgi:hypothetical protein
MATRQQIARLSQRIEALGASKDGSARPAYLWRQDGESDEEALARHHQDHPEDRSARQTYIFQWRGRRDRPDVDKADGQISGSKQRK